MLSNSILLAPEHNAVVIGGSPKLLQIFPHARELPTGQIVLPHQPTEVRVLRNLGYDVPSPILSDYDWRGTTPFNAQRITAAMLVVEPRAFVLSTMGTGKTRSVLFAYDYLRRKRLVKKMLVVAPLSTLSFVWAREVMQITSEYRVGIVYGTKERRAKILRDRSFDIYVINHDGVRPVADVIAQVPDLDVLCLDEAAVYRHSTTQKWKVMNKLSQRFRYVWGLTGTPTPREPTDAFGIIKLINPNAYPGSFTHFRDAMMTKVNNFKWVPRRGSDKHVYEIMQPAVRFTMDDCIDMPPVTFTNHEVKLGKKQLQVYEQLRKHCRMMIGDQNITAFNQGILVNKLLQVSGGCVYSDDHSYVVLDPENRLAALSELIEQNDRKSIVFVPYIPFVDIVADRLTKDGCIVHKVYGATKQAERTTIFEQF